jgi:hypothetical protein
VSESEVEAKECVVCQDFPLSLHCHLHLGVAFAETRAGGGDPESCTDEAGHSMSTARWDDDVLAVTSNARAARTSGATYFILDT